MLQLIIGSMFSGKSTTLLAHCIKNSYKSRVIILRPQIDTRAAITHHGAIDTSVLENRTMNNDELFAEIDFIISNYDTIGIDEIQFFDAAPIIKLLKSAIRSDKTVIAAGLNADYQMRTFETVSKILPYFDKVTKKSSFCAICFSDYGTVSDRIVQENTMQVLVGGAESYRALCTKCYLNKK